MSYISDLTVPLKDNLYLEEEDAARVVADQFDQFKQEAYLMRYH